MYESLYNELQLRAQLLTEMDPIASFAKSITQLEAETTRLNDQIRQSQELQAKAHYFLTNNGINTQNILQPRNTSNSFQEVQEDRYVDMERFLREAHEIMIIENIEERRTQDDDEFDAFYLQQMHQILETRKNQAKQDCRLQDFGTEGVPLINHDVIKDINQHRIQNNVCDVVKLLSKNLSGLDIPQKSVQKAWSALKHIATHETDIKSEGHYLKSYISYHDLETRRHLIHASRSWLEKQYLAEMEEKLIKNAHTHHVGGIPSVIHRVKKYIEMEYPNHSGLEVVDELPIWLFLYILMRSGHWNTADQFIRDEPQLFNDDFITYYNEFRNAPNHCLSKINQDKILNDYYRLVYGEISSDPYKQIVYKVIGRCELHRMSLPIESSQDDIWLQMSLVREVTETERYQHQRYRLEDLQKEVIENKDQWCIDDETQWAYFIVLILTLQFEKAIEHLYNIKNLHVEAVHFAIALSYYGLLHIASSEMANRSELLIVENDQVLLNFGRLIQQYVYLFLFDRPKETLQYIYLLSLYSIRNGYTSDDMVELCRSSMINLVLRSNDFKSTLLYLIGDGDAVYQQLSLAGVNTKQDCIQHILFPLAESCVQMGRCEDAVHTYALSQDYNKVFDVLIKQLSDALQKPQSIRETDPSLSELTNQDIIEFSVSVINSYSPLMDMIDVDKHTTVQILMELVKFRMLYEGKDYRQAVQVVTDTGVFPLGDHNIQQTLDRFNTLHQAILRNLPELLLNVMDTLYKLWTEFAKNPTINQATLTTIESNVRHVLVFVGIIPFSIPGDIIQRLNQVEIQLTERKTF